MRLLVFFRDGGGNVAIQRLCCESMGVDGSTGDHTAFGERGNLAMRAAYDEYMSMVALARHLYARV